MATEISALQIVIGCLSGVVTSGGIGAFLIFILKGLERRIDTMDERLAEETLNRTDSIGETIQKFDERMKNIDFDFQKRMVDLGGLMDRKKTDKDLCKIVSTNIEQIYKDQQNITQEIYKNQIEQGKEIARMTASLVAMSQQLEKLTNRN